jgi:hypothetical protein
VTAIERWLLWISGAAATVTGLVYLWMKYLLTGSDPYSVVHHPLQPLVLKLHILVAPVLVFALGVFTVRHIWPQVVGDHPVARRSGLTTALVAGPMTLTGYLIQVLTDERWLRVVAWVHIAAGVVFAAGVVVHRFAGRNNGQRTTDNG